jgi:Asp-tRNA(Asn)/Glu-tRNA(Gln) amidotransferase A subunit family amidase
MGERRWASGVEPEEHEVTVRCGPCHDQGRSAPALARVVRRAGHRVIDVSAPRVTRRQAAAVVDAYKGHRAGWDMPHPYPDKYWSWARPNGARWIGKAIELRSRSCRHRPRKAPRDLYAAAEQALAQGQDVIYVC